MTVDHKYFSSLISPSQVLRGEEAWGKGKYLISEICKRPLILGRSQKTLALRNRLKQEIENLDIKVKSLELNYGCCELDLVRIQSITKKFNCDGVIAAGGGKVLDAGKLIANRLKIPCITVPLSPATCAGWTALSNIYSPEGAFIKDISLERCPNVPPRAG